MGYVGIAITVIFTAIGQFLLKGQIDQTMAAKTDDTTYLQIMVKLAMNPIVILAFTAAGCAALGWILAMMKLPFNVAYPIIVGLLATLPVIASVMFGETLTVVKVASIIMIFGGVILLSLQQ